MLTLQVKPLDTVYDVKVKIQRIEGMSVNDQRIMFVGQQLEDEFTLAHYNIVENAIVYAFIRIRGS